ncbi:uncharacterized protein LOC109544675 isoform X2 [Dendroctonus ponderosae]|uniref:Bromo domain-containing protein n=1 Tax=Dendroctonus ponderosae TaxID=77166 RepID=A0AAR5QBE8_DENPD|nr:uncharacterized protein LOC109544675 isoform X2 [Dendroctonus ponderosae]KAH1025623.1 hypothetical protein HUJ05_010314 [Dendroctonus ponderosae]
MDQNRSENGNSQQQNVHLHMHHVCNCQGGIYPSYYPTVGYRAPIPSLVPYHPTSTVARPYLQHYQYTQFNLGNQYGLPMGHVSGSNTSIYGPANSSSSTIDLVYAGAAVKDRREREDGTAEVDRINDPPEGYDFGQITPPANELLSTAEPTTQENFVKFLEKSCLTAEQIAYRNRNRPCFRNIQNLCIRTRSEILKPCTTISNIHSQGIPWATKDFIYAFVRLTNCWHILKGYWENRDGSSLGKIEKELTPEFRSCYVRWEKETMELAGQLTKIFYNLDTNLNTSSSGANVYSVNNLIPSQINLVKSASEGAMKKPTTSSDTATTSTVTNGSDSSRNIRGILHLPINNSPPMTETIDQANQTYSGDFCAKEEYDSEEERTRRVYMKPGSYNVPKKGLEPGASGNSPRGIEFLETAQNVNKVREASNGRYWANILLSAGKTLSQEYKSLSEADDSCPHLLESEVPINPDSSPSINVQEWLVNNNFSNFIEPQAPAALQELKTYYLDGPYNTLPHLDTSISIDNKNQYSSPITLLQQSIAPNGSGSTVGIANGMGETVISRSFRRPHGSSPIHSQTQGNESNPFELKGGGLTGIGQCALENVVKSFREHMMRSAVDGEINLENILQKIRTLEYSYVNEVVRDLRYMAKLIDEMDNRNQGWFSQKLELLLTEHFNTYDFSNIKGDLNESVGPLKSALTSIFTSDCDHFI